MAPSLFLIAGRDALWPPLPDFLRFFTLVHPPRPQGLNIDRLSGLVIGGWCAVHGAFVSWLIVDASVHYMHVTLLWSAKERQRLLRNFPYLSASSSPNGQHGRVGQPVASGGAGGVAAAVRVRNRRAVNSTLLGERSTQDPSLAEIRMSVCAPIRRPSLRDGGHRHATSESFRGEVHIDCYKGRSLFYVEGQQNIHVVCSSTRYAELSSLFNYLAGRSVSGKSETRRYVHQCVSKVSLTAIIGRPEILRAVPTEIIPS